MDLNRSKLEEKNMKKALVQMRGILPIMMGMVMMVNLIMPVVMKGYKSMLSGNMMVDSIIASIVGSISFGNPVTSYMVGRNFLDQGAHVAAVTAFMVSWATIGMVAIPLEASLFGKRFTLVRNMTNLIFSVLIAIATELTLNIF